MADFWGLDLVKPGWMVVVDGGVVGRVPEDQTERLDVAVDERLG